MVDEPLGAGGQGDQASHQRRGHLPQRSWSAAPGRTDLLKVHDEWQLTERRYLSEASRAKLYETDQHGANDKEVGTKTKELLAG